MRYGRKQWYAKALEGEPIRFPAAYAFAISTIPLTYKENGDSYDWVPIKRLHDLYEILYLERAGKQSEAMRPEFLNLKQFAIVCRLAFPNGTPCRRNGADGVRYSGIAGVTGPLAERTPHERETFTRWRKKIG